MMLINTSMKDDQYNNPSEVRKAKRKAWADKNRERLREYHRLWRGENRSRLRAAFDRNLGKPKVIFTATPAHLALATDDPTRLAMIDRLANCLRTVRATDFRHDAQGYGFTVILNDREAIPGIREAMAGHYEVEVVEEVEQ